MPKVDSTKMVKHPHMRGEDDLRHSCQADSGETPPHAWGRRNFVDASGSYGRNTPTCVGKTFFYRISGTKNKKHPHMRGEDPERSLNFFLHTWY